MIKPAWPAGPIHETMTADRIEPSARACATYIPNPIPFSGKEKGTRRFLCVDQKCLSEFGKYRFDFGGFPVAWFLAITELLVQKLDDFSR